MPDISMCQNDTCRQCQKCYRFMAEPNGERQAYADFEPVFGECEYFLPLHDKDRPNP